MIEVDQQIKDCNGMVVVTPEYNATLPPALTAFMDNFSPASYCHKPAALACYSMGQQ